MHEKETHPKNCGKKYFFIKMNKIRFILII